jgi:hypothetical protein
MNKTFDVIHLAHATALAAPAADHPHPVAEPAEIGPDPLR